MAIVWHNQDRYYTCLSVYYPEGHWGGSAGMQVRTGYQHIVACGRNVTTLQRTFAHEMVHLSLAHLSLPLWLEEGLARMFEEDIGGRRPLVLDTKGARRHKRYWGKHGLESFWRGKSFHRSGKVQLAEILLRLLASEHRPRWFGFDREPQRRLLNFIRNADACDCGEAAAQEHLRFGLGDLAAKFLGPGDWTPPL